MGYYFTGREAADLDNWITGHYREDDPAVSEPEPEYDPRDDEPADLDERRDEHGS